MNDKHCYKCGTKNPEHKVNKYKRDCMECGGMGSVLEVNELIDLVNDLDLRGLLPPRMVEDAIEEDFSLPELDFDADAMRAEVDAYNDYLEGEL